MQTLRQEDITSDVAEESKLGRGPVKFWVQMKMHDKWHVGETNYSIRKLT